MRRFRSDRCYEHEDGEFVLDVDAEAAIAEARQDERRKCVAEVRGLQVHKFYIGEDEWLSPRHGLQIAADHLSKGLTQ